VIARDDIVRLLRWLGETAGWPLTNGEYGLLLANRPAEATVFPGARESAKLGVARPEWA
jgi:hypothetical protein